MSFQEIISRKKIEEQLFESEARWESILSLIPDGVLVIDENQQIQIVNESAERVFGYSANEMKGKDVNMLIPESFRQRHRRLLEVFLKTGTSQIIGVGREVEGLKKDGTLIPLYLKISQTILIDGHIKAIAILHDLTLEKELERYIAQKNMAEQANRLKSAFLANMSHDIRTPLNGIISMGQTALRRIKRGKVDLDKAIEYFQDIVHSGQNLAEIINDILDLSKIEAGKLEMHFEPVSFLQIIDGLQSTLAHIAQEKKLQLQVDIPDEFPPVYADRVRLTQVIFNLVGNAIKFTEKGHVTISGKIPENTVNVTIQISDTGPGIPEDFHAIIFNEFTQKSDMHTGSGLGLAISQKLVQMMGGSIWFETNTNEKKHGTIFYFTLKKWGEIDETQRNSIGG